MTLYDMSYKEDSGYNADDVMNYSNMRVGPSGTVNANVPYIVNTTNSIETTIVTLLLLPNGFENSVLYQFQ